MPRKHRRFGKGFRVVFGNARAQAAAMVLPPGEAEASPENRHRGADLWRSVVAGTGSALANGTRDPLRPGTLLRIEPLDTHEIKHTGREVLRTLNLDVPPAYTASGEERPPAKP